MTPDRDAPPGQRTEPQEPTPSRADMPPAPTTILNGKYRIDRVIGQGAFGRVYLAFDPLLRRNVAIKELLAARGTTDSATYERYLERFQREARAAGGLEHPNIVTVYELVVAEDGAYYLVMQYVDGTDVRELLRSVGTLPVERAVAIAMDIARALEAAHDADIVHRDIKPANIMLTSRGVAKLTDFGIAQVGNESHRTQMQIGHPGTPIYMSPEQAASAEYLDGRSDLYSLGLVFFEMLTGETYVRRKQPLGTVRGDLPPQLVRIVDKLMERDLNARYQSAADLLLDLGKLSLMSVAERTGAETLLPHGADAHETVLPSTTGRAPTSDPVEGVPAAYGGPASGIPPGAPLPSVPASLDPSVPPATTRRRGLLIGIGALLALVIVGGGVGAFLLTRGSDKNDTNRILPTIPPPANWITADLSKWATDTTPNSRRTYDQATSEYHLALLNSGANILTTAPSIQTTADFIIDADVRRVSGGEAGEYGLVFRNQAKGANDRAEAHYTFRIDARGEYSLLLVNADSTVTVIQPLTTSNAIRTGDATNHLTVLCKGDMITLAINGRTVGSWKATLTKPGGFGVSAATPPNANTGIDGAFKNVRYAPA